MTEDHRFVDALGVQTTGRRRVRDTWRGYLQTFPDYRIRVSEFAERDAGVEVRGNAQGTVPGDPASMSALGAGLDVQAAWRAVVRDGRVAEWHVLGDA